MIGPAANVRVLVATGPADFRKEADVLAALVAAAFAGAAFSGAIFCFCARKASRVTLIWWGGTGAVPNTKLR